MRDACARSRNIDSRRQQRLQQIPGRLHDEKLSGRGDRHAGERSAEGLATFRHALLHRHLVGSVATGMFVSGGQSGQRAVVRRKKPRGQHCKNHSEAWKRSIHGMKIPYDEPLCKFAVRQRNEGVLRSE